MNQNKEYKESLIYALHREFPSMKINSNTRHLLNEEYILSNIGQKYQLDPSDLEHLEIVTLFDGLHFGIGGIPIEDLLIPLWQDKVLTKIRVALFPQLTEDILFSVLFGICRIVNSTRLEIRDNLNIVDDTDWYFYQTENGYTINRQYFYEGLQSYSMTKEKTKLFGNYLSATSSSPNGGLKSIAYFDVTKLEDTYEVMVPDTQFSYQNILDAIINENHFQKLIKRKAEFENSVSLKAVQVGLSFLQKLWSYFSIKIGSYKLSVSIFDTNADLIIRNNTYNNQVWNDTIYKIYESCHFYRMDFSGLVLESDFIFCTFEECNFLNTSLPPEGVQGRFPILRCTFKNCKNIPKSIYFQYGLSNCKFIYE